MTRLSSGFVSGSFIPNRSFDLLRDLGCDFVDVVYSMGMFRGLLQDILFGIPPCHEIAATNGIGTA